MGVLFIGANAVQAAPLANAPTASEPSGISDELPNPQEDQRREARQTALKQVLNGTAKVENRGGSKVVKVGSKSTAGKRQKSTGKIDRYVELSREKTDKIFVVLAEFGNQRHPSYPDQDTDPNTAGPAVFDGPLHNKIPQPDRTKDNSTYWQSDFNRQHFQNMYFGSGPGAESLKTYYEKQSSGRYSVDGMVTDWVKVPDGYIDHFQIVHAGGDQADGDLLQGEDAIWSHRWAAFQNNTSGPPGNLRGGVQVGNTGLWVSDYTIQPENGGLSVFAHEYGHDLGLPDHYDTSGAGGLQENPVNWWTIMAQSRVSKPGDNAIGSRAADFGAWDKLQLGWLDYEVVVAGQKKTLDLGPHEYNSKKAQAVVVVLPKKAVTTPLQTPPEGTHQWWSGRGDLLENTLTRSVSVPAGSTSLTFQANWSIEDCGPDPCDYAYVEVDDGSGFKAIPGSITKPAEGNGIDGNSNGWVPASFDLSAYAGKTVQLRFRYSADLNTGGYGLFVDDIKIGTVFSDGAENGNQGWTANGFSIQTATLTQQFDNYYIASHRTYASFDQYLHNGVYHFGYLNTKPKWVDRFSYETGLEVTYWDTSFTDNNTSQHFGGGLILPIDAHPDLVYKLDGLPWRPRIQGYDAPFSLTKADSFTLHDNSVANYIRGQNGVSTFDDSKSYYREDAANNVHYGVKVPNNGVKIKVLSEDGTSMKIRIS